MLALAGLALASLIVRVGDEHGDVAEKAADGDYTAAYEEGTLTITMVANGTLVDAAQCYIEIDKAAAGANEADCILTDAVITGTTTGVVAEAYTSGVFNRNALIVADDDSIANHEKTLRSKGIILKDNIAY